MQKHTLIQTISYHAREFKDCPTVFDQKELRKQTIVRYLTEHGIDLDELDAFVTRGGQTEPVNGGVYRINKEHVEQAISGKYGTHVCSVGSAIALELCEGRKAVPLTVDTPCTDEFEPLARYSGLKEIARISSFQALNHKAMAKYYAKSVGKDYREMNLVVCMLGGGITVAAHKRGKMIDGPDGLEGDGPFSNNRCCTVPVGSLVKLCYSGRYDLKSMMKHINGEAGLVAYLGTTDIRAIEKTANEGDKKSAVTVVGFGKTKTLAPNESETLTISVERRELASYDAYGEKTYILENGDYYLTAGKNAHDAVNNILAAKGFTPEGSNGVMDDAGNAELVFTYNNPAFDAETYSVSKHGVAITNQFDNADLNLYDNGQQAITYLSRSDWEGTFPKTVELYITETMAADLADRRYTGEGSADIEMPDMGSTDGGLKLIELRGADFDDPRWDTLLDQMTYEEMSYLVGHAFHWTMPVESVDLPGTRDENGPQGLTATLLKGEVASTSFTSEDVMAATWNRELIAQVGRMIGEDCLANGYAGIYGPGANNHRTPYSGRNFEYYSEDGFLAGKMCETEVTAIQNTGTYVFLKHCVLNDSESDRESICTWANEQSIREIYLKAFQYALEENDTAGIMNSYSRIGCLWNGAHAGMEKGVIRGEWGNHGMLISDNTSMYAYMDGIDGTLAGTTLYDSMMAKQYTSLKELNGDDPVVVSALREACHYNLFALVNSCAMNGITVYDEIVATMPTWHVMLYVLTFLFAAAWIGCIVWRVVNSKKNKGTHEKPVKPVKAAVAE